MPRSFGWEREPARERMDTSRPFLYPPDVDGHGTHPLTNAFFGTCKKRTPAADARPGGKPLYSVPLVVRCRSIGREESSSCSVDRNFSCRAGRRGGRASERSGRRRNPRLLPGARRLRCSPGGSQCDQHGSTLSGVSWSQHLPICGSGRAVPQAPASCAGSRDWRDRRRSAPAQYR